MRDADEEATERDARIATAEGVALAVSTGMLALLLRSGSLWALALSALPLWRRVDPLAVLALGAEERRKLERDLREAARLENTTDAGLARVLDRASASQQAVASPEPATAGPEPDDSRHDGTRQSRQSS